MLIKQSTLKKIILVSSFITCVSSLAFANHSSSVNCEDKQLSTAEIKECFTGTWKLVSNMKKEGDVITYPYGKDAVGYITYEANGYMSVQMMQRNRKTPVPGYFAYFGRYDIDQKTKVVHHYLDGSLAPADVGTDRQRGYQFIGNQLHLTPVEETNREIIWEKMN